MSAVKAPYSFEADVKDYLHTAWTDSFAGIMWKYVAYLMVNSKHLSLESVRELSIEEFKDSVSVNNLDSELQAVAQDAILQFRREWGQMERGEPI